jgi:hypothetical protein
MRCSLDSLLGIVPNGLDTRPEFPLESTKWPAILCTKKGGDGYYFSTGGHGRAVESWAALEPEDLPLLAAGSDAGYLDLWLVRDLEKMLEADCAALLRAAALVWLEQQA